MVREAGVELLLHAWGTRPIMEGNTVKGVIFESKSGRQAVLGKVVIDSTGDGDIFVGAGAAFDNNLSPALRTSKLAIVFWLANVDIARTDVFRAAEPARYDEIMEELKSREGHPFYFKGILESQKNCVWFHFFQVHPDGVACDAMDVEELTMMDIRARKRALTTYEFFKKHIPGFEESFIMLTGPQIGIQGGRRVIGEYTLSEKDMGSDEVFPRHDRGPREQRQRRDIGEAPALCVPYRCLVPEKVDGLLVACRAFSSADSINHHFNIVPHCLSYGQGAGTAAAIAAAAGVQPRNVDYKALRKALIDQGVNLP